MQTRPLSTRETAFWMVVSVAAFHLACQFAIFDWLIAVYVFGLVQLTRCATPQRAFQSSLIVGLLIASPHLWFFAGIFNVFALFLWLVLATWTALFVLLAQLARLRFGTQWGLLLTPFLWMGIEYFRCESYWLRFTWLIPGYTFAGHGRPLMIGTVGIYGIGFLLAAIAAAISALRPARQLTVGGFMLAALAVTTNSISPPEAAESRSVEGPVIAGIQLESPDEEEVIAQLDRAIERHRGVELIVLSEYTFKESIPESVRDWCRTHQRYLIAGGRDRPAETPGFFYNTAFVVSPAGEIIFKQAKRTPIQFLNDGLPARSQELWESPWGKIGICICYDLSYTRNIDPLIEQGAQLLIVPTMDARSWGRHEHELHAKVGPTRAAEYGVPIVRVCSSGISQLVQSNGVVTASLPFPGQGESFSARVGLVSAGRVPPDRRLAFASMVFTTGFALYVLVLFVRGHDVDPSRPERGRRSRQT